MIQWLIYFLVAVILISVAIWATTLIPDVKIQQIARIVIVVIAAIALCYFLLDFANGNSELGRPHHLSWLQPKNPVASIGPPAASSSPPEDNMLDWFPW